MTSISPVAAGSDLSSDKTKELQADRARELEAHRAHYLAESDRRAYETAEGFVKERIHCRDRAINMCTVGLFERHSMTSSLHKKVYPLKKTESEIFVRTLVRNWRTDRDMERDAKLRNNDAGALFLMLYTFFPWNDWADWSYANEGLRRLKDMHRDIDELSMSKIQKKNYRGELEEDKNYRYHPNIAANYKAITDARKDQAKVTEAFFK